MAEEELTMEQLKELKPHFETKLKEVEEAIPNLKLKQKMGKFILEEQEKYVEGGESCRATYLYKYQQHPKFIKMENEALLIEAKSSLERIEEELTRMVEAQKSLSTRLKEIEINESLEVEEKGEQ
jgi:hypothetical protein